MAGFFEKIGKVAMNVSNASDKALKEMNLKAEIHVLEVEIVRIKEKF